MNTTIIRILTTLSILFSMINASGQTCPNKNLQWQMQTEEPAFLANMKPGLQHTQMLAVRDAMKGDYSALEQIRQSRNQAPVLPDMIYFSTRLRSLPGDFSALDILFHIMCFRQRHISLSQSLASQLLFMSPSGLSPAS